MQEWFCALREGRMKYGFLLKLLSWFLDRSSCVSYARCCT